MGGILQVMVLVNLSGPSVMSVHLSTTTCEEDPEDKRSELTDQEMDEYALDVAGKWDSLSYQRQMLGGETMEEYLEH